MFNYLGRDPGQKQQHVKLRIPLSFYMTAYFVLMLLLYHLEVKHYFYWTYVAEIKDMEFGLSGVRLAIASLIFGLNVYVLTRMDREKLIFAVLALFFLILTVPSLIAFTAGPIYETRILVYHQAFFFALYLLSRIRFKYTGLPVLEKRQAIWLFLGIIFLGTIPFLIVYGPHINLKNLLLLDVYETRTRMAGLSNAYFGYTYSPFTKIIIPLIIVFSLEIRDKFMLLAGVFLLVLFYLFGAHKTVYLGLVVILVFYRWNYFRSVRNLVLYSNLFIILCLVLSFFEYDYPWILTFRRIHFLPTLLDTAYFDFFAGNPMYWSESILKGFFDYPYDVKHEILIGQEYFNRDDVAANNGLISEGFMNFGSIGVAINILIIGVYFTLLNRMHIHPKYFGLFVLVIFSFLSSSLFTVMLTHGALFLFLVALFLLRRNR